MGKIKHLADILEEEVERIRNNLNRGKIKNLKVQNVDDNEETLSDVLIRCNPDDSREIESPRSNKEERDPILSKSELTRISNESLKSEEIDVFSENSENENSEEFHEKINKIIERENKLIEYELDEDDECDVECTLAIIKPEAFIFKNSIKKRIIEEGFEICGERILQLSAEEASELYSKEYGKLHFPLLTVYLSSGPVAALVLAKPRAVREWRRLMGPKDVKEAKLCFPSSIRAIYGETTGVNVENVVHGSSTNEEARDEIQFFFPNFIVEPLLPPNDLEFYLKKTVFPILTEGLVHLFKEKPINPIIWLADWLSENHPDRPKILI